MSYRQTWPSRRFQRCLPTEDLPPLEAADWARRKLNFSPDPKQAKILNCTDPRLLVVASRQIGKSTLAAIRALFVALYYPNSLILLIGPVNAQAGELLAKVKAFAAELGLPIQGDGHNRLSLCLPNGSRIVARSAVARSVRGYSKARLVIVDEAAFIAERTYQALSPILAASQGSLWLLSTPNGQTGRFAELWQEADPAWTRIAITAEECPRFSPDFLAGERTLHGDRSYRQEYLCEFLPEEKKLLAKGQIDAVQITQKAVLPKRAHYYFGLDLGKRQDHTALVAVEYHRNRLTVRYAAQLPIGYPTTKIPQFVRRILRRFRGPGKLLVDATGNGHTVVELLRTEPIGLDLRPISIHGGRLTSKLADGYTGVPKSELLTTLKRLIVRKSLLIERQSPGIASLKRELIEFEPTGRQAEHDDLVIALAMPAWQAVLDYPKLLP